MTDVCLNEVMVAGAASTIRLCMSTCLRDHFPAVLADLPFTCFAHRNDCNPPVCSVLAA